MTDKDVGELWRRANDDRLWSVDDGYKRYDYRRLIGKLVKDRQMKLAVLNQTTPMDALEIKALRDFDIDPKTW